MGDPILDEDYIITLLRAGPEAGTTGEAVAIVQQGAIQALMDIYDRKVTRDEFSHLASPCIALYGQAAKLWLLNNIHDVFAGGDLDEARFRLALDALVELMRKQSDTVIEIVERLKQCPTSQDKLH